MSSAFPIVGIGASAGGIEALEGFFRGLPADPRLAIVIVTHLSPERESALDRVVQRHTALPVHIACDGQAVEPGHVYVMPAGHVLTLRQQTLHLRADTTRRERRPIDVFFSALAVAAGDRAAAVLLSGGDADGTLGTKAIKEFGGVTFAQSADGFGPQHADMPQAAISTGIIDFAMPAEHIGPRLVEFFDSAAGYERLLARLQSDDREEPAMDELLPDIYAILRTQVGHDFSGYKRKTFLRRLQRRMQVTQLRSLRGYVDRLRQDPEEVGALFRDLLINVTNFFRDADAFGTLDAQVLPTLFEGRGARDTVRVWVPGCATGEEAFSLGILLREHMDTLKTPPRVQIFASDIDERALGIARSARYPQTLIDGVSPERRARFFIADGDSFVVTKDVRDLCVFSAHSVIRDPPFSRIDLISCRNLLIYFGVEIQSQVIPTFHYALRPDGYLFLGSAENVTQFEDLFAPIDKRHRIFRRRSDVGGAVRVPLALSALRPGHVGDLLPRPPPLGPTALRQATDRQVLERFSPPHVVVNRDGDVVFYSTRTGKYLEPPAGAPTRQFLTLARRGLRLDLRTLFREAVESGRTATRENVSVETDDGRVQLLTLTIEPLREVGATESMFLVLFTDQGAELTREEAQVRAESGYDGVIAHAEHELRETRDRLQSTIEEYETALEELKSSNEEPVSMNEEMQSTNEELEASKEELQSVNEELHTVNAELTTKIDEIDDINNDLNNLFAATDVATLFLDRHLVIRSFTPSLANVFRILPSDRGRPIGDLACRLTLPGFAQALAAVVRDHQPFEQRVDGDDQATHYLMRLAPYRDSNGRPDGVCATFLDISSVRRAEQRQQLMIAELQHRTRNLLALVQSIATQTIDAGKARSGFFQRLAALSRVQGLLGSGVDEDVDLGDMIRLELQAAGAAATKSTLQGPRVALPFEAMQTMGLALHELATNATKHGALKQADAMLEVTWRVDTRSDGGRALVLDWHERGVDMRGVDMRGAERGSGFGRELIERALPFTLNAQTDLRFTDDGVVCRIVLPLAGRGRGWRGGARGGAGSDAAPDAPA